MPKIPSRHKISIFFICSTLHNTANCSSKGEDAELVNDSDLQGQIEAFNMVIERKKKQKAEIQRAIRLKMKGSELNLLIMTVVYNVILDLPIK